MMRTGFLLLPGLPCLLILISSSLLLLSPMSRVQANDTIPMAPPRNGTTRSPFHPTFAPGAASTPVVPPRKPSSPPSLLGSRFLSFLRSVRGTLEDVVSGVDPGVTRVLYQETGQTEGQTEGRVAEIILRKSSILTGGGSRIIGCRIFPPNDVKGTTTTTTTTSTTPSPENEGKAITRRLISRRQMSNLVKNCADIDKMKPYMIPTLKTEQQLLSDKRTELDKKKKSNGTYVMSGSTLTARKSTPEEEKNGVFDGVAIYPGTKWCGAGDIATNDDDLGHEKEADACCRTHDKCPDAIPAGESKYNLTNSASYTKSACECDTHFYQCLQEAATFVGDQVGRLYFNVLQIQCFRTDYPIIKCLDEKG